MNIIVPELYYAQILLLQKKYLEYFVPFFHCFIDSVFFIAIQPHMHNIHKERYLNF